MKHISESVKRYIDFHFALALVAILGTAGSLYLQFDNAGTEFDALNASVYSYSVVRIHERDLMENESLDQELDELGRLLDALNLNY